MDGFYSFSQEAIPERDPAYELPDSDDEDEAPVTLSCDDDRRWREMVRRRPVLAQLRPAS